MTDRTYETRFLSLEEKRALRQLHQKLMTMPRKKRIAHLFAWTANYAYQQRNRDGMLWLGRFQNCLCEIIDICLSRKLRNPKIFEALVTGDTKTIQVFFKNVHFPENENLTLFPGIRSNMPRKGLLIRDIEGSSTMSEQVFFVFDPLMDMADHWFWK